MIAASPAPSLFPSSVNSVSLCLALFFRPSTLQTRGGTSPRYRPALNHPLKRYSTILPLSVGCQLLAVSSPVNRLFVLSPFNFKLPALFTLSLEGSGVEGSTVDALYVISFRMNTYISVSKQRTLSYFRMNTYEKTGEGPLERHSATLPLSVGLRLFGWRARGAMDGLADALVGAATANVAAHGVVNVRVGGFWFF